MFKVDTEVRAFQEPHRGILGTQGTEITAKLHGQNLNFDYLNVDLSSISSASKCCCECEHRQLDQGRRDVLRQKNDKKILHTHFTLPLRCITAQSSSWLLML